MSTVHAASFPEFRADDLTFSRSKKGSRQYVVLSMRRPPPPAPCTASLVRGFKANPAGTKPFLVDLNPSLIFAQGHTNHATNIPVHTLESRLHELPPPPCVLLIFAKRRHVQAVAALLLSKGYTPVPLVYHPGPVVSGSASRAIWRPAPIVETFLYRYNFSGSALDIACGCGRDAKFLTMHGFNVTAIDRDEKLLRKARNLHKSHYYSPLWRASSTGSLTTIRRTLGADRNDDIDFLRTHAANLVIVIRFLRRGVLELLHETVAPGGYILYEHFLEGCQDFGGPMKKSQMLQSGELRQVFSKKRGFKVLREDEEQLDDGRPVTRFIARRLEVF